MMILGIDTSCDDTCVSILEIKNGKLKILSNVISSQIKIHRKYGGVFPSLAKRKHQENLILVLKKALRKANLLKKKQEKEPISQKKIDILKKILDREKTLLGKLIGFLEEYQKPVFDILAVTVGPGLEPCLWVGVNFTKALSYFWNIDVFPVNHIEAHIVANFVGKSQISNLNQVFPAVALIASGGHTQLILVEKIGKYKILGETRDDAAGECLDKVARILELPYPGGPEIERLAKKSKMKIFKLKLPRPLFYSKDYDFSFSGLKTAVLYKTKKFFPRNKEKREVYIREMAREVQEAIVDVLVRKTVRAARDFQVKSILLGGGVIANKELRKRFLDETKKDAFYIFAPPPGLCTDNAAMVALSGFLAYKRKSLGSWKKLKVNANLKF